MAKLYMDFCRFNEEGKILDLNFLTRYAKSLTHIYNADQNVKKLQIRRLPKDTYALYIFKKHKIIISYENIIKEIELEQRKRFNIRNQSQVIRLNMELLFSVSHECYHAVQESIITDPNNKTIISKLFTDSYYTCCDAPDLYVEGYDYIPIEVNADILGKLKTLKFINMGLAKETAMNNNKIIMNEIKGMITDEDGKPIEVARKFYKIINKEDRYERLMRNCNLSDFQKLFLGLPVSEEYFARISSICDGTTQPEKLKQYLKK